MNVLVLLGVYMFGGSKGAATLESWKAWLSKHNSTIVIGLLVVMSAEFVTEAIIALT
ncbi:hypothetical protein ACFU98_38085 [Streptomyces sp. NPDC057575]|uniref:hypothetical protein n=1 Tax=unclassified Streptomyces TaxID=2593676 RepID=UPI0036B52577